VTGVVSFYDLVLTFFVTISGWTALSDFLSLSPGFQLVIFFFLLSVVHFAVVVVVCFGTSFFSRCYSCREVFSFFLPPRLGIGYLESCPLAVCLGHGSSRQSVFVDVEV